MSISESILKLKDSILKVKVVLKESVLSLSLGVR